MANNNRLRVVARKQLSLSSTFCIFVLMAELRLAGRCTQAMKPAAQTAHLVFADTQSNAKKPKELNHPPLTKKNC